jgi:hypothetical protein
MRAGEPVPAAEEAAASGSGLTLAAKITDHERAPEAGRDRGKPNSTACIGMAEHAAP